MSDKIVLDGEISLKIALDGEIDSVIKVGHEVVTEALTVTENGTYQAPDGVDGYTPVTVAIPAPTAQSKTVTPTSLEQTVTPDEGYDYLSAVTVGGVWNPFKDMTNYGSIFLSAQLPETVTIDFEGATISSLYKSFNSVSGCKHLVLKNMCSPEGAGIACQDAFRGSSLEVLEFVGCDFIPANNQYPFYQSRLREIIGSINMTYRTAGIISEMTYLEDVRFVPNTIHNEFTIYNSKKLSHDSLISIANGLNAEMPGQIDMRFTGLVPTIQAITGNVTEGVFAESESGTMTLYDFITFAKGWTIRS